VPFPNLVILQVPPRLKGDGIPDGLEILMASKKVPSVLINDIQNSSIPWKTSGG